MANKTVGTQVNWATDLGGKELESLMEEYTSRLEKRVAYESRFFSLMADAMPQIVWTAQPNGTPDYFNKRWYEYTGLPEESPSIDNDWLSIIHDDDIEKAQSLWAESIKNKEPFEAELRFCDDKNDTYRWFLVRALPGRDSSGKIIKWFGTCTDIDEHKKAQANKDEFIAITSHELKTPLTSLKAFSQILEAQLKKDKSQKNNASIVKNMNIQINRLGNLVNDLLEISLLETGKLRLKKRRFSLDKFVKDVVKDMQLISDDHKLVIKGHSGRTVMADRDRLEQALTNIISNAE